MASATIRTSSTVANRCIPAGNSSITGILRERLGFDVIVCTDWGLLTDVEITATPMGNAEFGTVVTSPAEADIALLRLKAPFDTRKTGFESFFHNGPLAFPDEEIARILGIAKAVPTREYFR